MPTPPGPPPRRLRARAGALSFSHRPSLWPKRCGARNARPTTHFTCLSFTYLLWVLPLLTLVLRLLLLLPLLPLVLPLLALVLMLLLLLLLLLLLMLLLMLLLLLLLMLLLLLLLAMLLLMLSSHRTTSPLTCWHPFGLRFVRTASSRPRRPCWCGTGPRSGPSARRTGPSSGWPCAPTSSTFTTPRPGVGYGEARPRSQTQSCQAG